MKTRITVLLVLCFFGLSAVAHAQKGVNKPLKLLTKPRAEFTEQARAGNIQGEVELEVTFKKSGEIGKIKILKPLSAGLTENAVEAAKKIRFEPEIRNGKPVTIKRKQVYTFRLY